MTDAAPTRPGAMTAAAAVALMQERIRTDPTYRAALAAAEAEHEQHQQAMADAEQPIAADLRRAGVPVTSVWDLVSSPEPYPEAIPVLLEHLQRTGYPDRVMESMGRALAKRPAGHLWPAIRALYLQTDSPGAMNGLAIALVTLATRARYKELASLLSVDSRGDTRVHFLRPIKRLGGAEGRALLESLTTDPVFGREATHLTKRRHRNPKDDDDTRVF